jgi:hypothetical protein
MQKIKYWKYVQILAAKSLLLLKIRWIEKSSLLLKIRRIEKSLRLLKIRWIEKSLRALKSPRLVKNPHL